MWVLLRDHHGINVELTLCTVPTKRLLVLPSVFQQQLAGLEPWEQFQEVQRIIPVVSKAGEYLDEAAGVINSTVRAWPASLFKSFDTTRASWKVDTSYNTNIANPARRSRKYKGRKEAALNSMERCWGPSWERQLGSIYPARPAHDFVVSMAVIARHATIAEAKVALRQSMDDFNDALFNRNRKRALRCRPPMEPLTQLRLLLVRKVARHFVDRNASRDKAESVDLGQEDQHAEAVEAVSEVGVGEDQHVEALQAVAKGGVGEDCGSLSDSISGLHSHAIMNLV